MAINKITTDNFEQEVLQSDRPVLVDFFADWCGPCQRLAPVVEEIAAEEQNIKVCQVDIDKQPQLAQKYGVMGVPTLAFFRNGNLMKTTIGFCEKQEILQMMQA